MRTKMSRPKIVVCLGSSCFSRGNGDLIELIESYLKTNGVQDDVDVELSGTLCQDHCSEGPNVMIDGVFYHHVDTGVMLDLLNEHVKQKVAP